MTDWGISQLDLGLTSCKCPVKDGMIYHQRDTCTDPIAARLDWFADGQPAE